MELDVGREWDAYEDVSKAICDGEYTNGDLVFVITVMLAELVKEEGFDFEDLMQDIRESTLTNIKIMSHG